jgi:hypothetical protein
MSVVRSAVRQCVRRYLPYPYGPGRDPRRHFCHRSVNLPGVVGAVPSAVIQQHRVPCDRAQTVEQAAQSTFDQGQEAAAVRWAPLRLLTDQLLRLSGLRTQPAASILIKVLASPKH